MGGKVSVPGGASRSAGRRDRKALTIGAVAELLAKEFDDISISKIRYLEDQKLVSPRRTNGGYRLYSQADVDRLREILRLQRDEFLPLRVIRQELASNPVDGSHSGSSRGRANRRAKLLTSSAPTLSSTDLSEEAGADEKFLRELSDFGLLAKSRSADELVYDETDVAIVVAARELLSSGLGARNLRMFRTSADREEQLLEALLAPKLMSRNPQRRKEGEDTLEEMVSLMAELKNALLIRNLRRLISE